MSTRSSLPDLPLTPEITSNYISCPSTKLVFHYLEAGHTPENSKPLILLLHGYPELAFSWRKVIPSLAKAGYHVVAPDQRGYGRTTGWDNSPFERTDLNQFSMTNLVRDMVILVNALGYREVKCVVGHDFGAMVANMCSLMRPDIFLAVVTMSHPINSPPALPFNTAHNPDETEHGKGGGMMGTDIDYDLARVEQPRKHYRWYNSALPAAEEWLHPSQGLKTFLRGYIHVKSADYNGNDPKPLKEWSAKELSKMPYYYIMPKSSNMPDTITSMMENEDASKTTRWLSDDDLDIYVQEWSRTGFQGGLNWYRARTDPEKAKDVLLFAGRKVDVPSIFISGKQDWGNYQQPGALEGIDNACSDSRGIKFIDGAGHWPQQEQPERVAEELLAFLSQL
ncbi:Phenol 2-monooxygenase [Venturia inaequalis]|nr:Phenol 2-monooxygenase [Venturia inaequalis]